MAKIQEPLLSVPRIHESAFRYLLLKNHQLRIAFPENPPAANCFSGKSTSREVPVQKISQLQSACSNNPPNFEMLFLKVHQLQYIHT